MLSSKLATCLLALAFAPGSRSDDWKFVAREGLVLTKHFELKSDSRLELARVETDGVPQEIDLEMSFKTLASVRVRDHYQRLKQERPVALERRFDAIQFQSEAFLTLPVTGPQDLQAKGQSSLQGQSVRFLRASPEEAWEVLPGAGSELPQAALEGLRFDLEFQELLPPGPVAPGDVWDVPASLIERCLSPGGDLALELQTGVDSALQLPKGSHFPALSDATGEVKASLLALESTPTGRIATIELSVEVTSLQDLSAELQALLKMGVGPGGIEMRSQVNSYSANWSLKAKGKALWNLELGHLQSLTLEGDHRLRIESNMDVIAAGLSQSILNQLDLKGSTQATITFTPSVD